MQTGLKFFERHHDLLIIIGVFIVTKFLAIVLASAVLKSLDTTIFPWAERFEPVSDNLLASLFYHHDGINYIAIAQNGYFLSSPDPFIEGWRFAFFPLYPLLIYLSGLLVFDLGVGAIIISNVFSFLSVLTIYKLARLYKVDALKTALCLLVYPYFILFGTVAYTDTILLFFILGSFYYYKLGRTFGSSLFTFLAVLTRSPGMLLVIFYIAAAIMKSQNLKSVPRELFRERKFILAQMIAGASAILLVFGYFFSQSGDFLIWFKAEEAVWRHRLVVPWEYLIYNLRGVIENHSLVYSTRILLSIPAILSAVYWGIHYKLKREFAIFTLIFLITYSIQGGQADASIPRFYITIFPMYLFISTIVTRTRAFFAAYLITGLGVGMFALWGFFTFRGFL